MVMVMMVFMPNSLAQNHFEVQNIDRNRLPKRLHFECHELYDAYIFILNTLTVCVAPNWGT